MNSPKNQQIEFDVFPKDPKDSYAYLSGVKGAGSSSDATPINVVFSQQSIIIVFIGIILLLVASFTLGVEKGKLVARNSARQEKAVVPAALLANAVPETAPDPAATKKQAVLPLAPVVTTAATDPKSQAPRAEISAENPAVGGYAIQVASVKTKDSAQRLADNLTKNGWKSFIKPSGNYIIVLAGNFTKREDAKNSVKELKKTYSDCFIKKI